MKIRAAEFSDVQPLMALLEQLGYTATAEEIQLRIEKYQQPGYGLFVGELESSVIGFAAVHWYDAFHHQMAIGRLVAFVIDENKRKQQFGGKLLEFIELFLRKKGCFKVELTSNLQRTTSHQFYRNRGYRQSSLHLNKML